MKPRRVCLIATDHPKLELYCPNWFGMKKGLERMGVDYRFFSCRPLLDVQGVIKYRPDLVIYGLRDMVLNKAWRKEIRAALPDARIVIWYGDYRDESTGQNDANCSEVDAMFISNDNQEDYYRKKWRVPRVHFLPLACEPMPRRRFNEKYSFPFVFIGGLITGSAFAERASLMEKFKIMGNLTVVNSFEPAMRAQIFKRMPEIYSSSGVSLDVSHFTDVNRYTSIRYWEIPAFWGFALTKRWPGCEEFYPEGSRVYFDTVEEAIEKKDYYLEHEGERMAIIAKAHRLSYNHTYKERFERMFSLL